MSYEFDLRNGGQVDVVDVAENDDDSEFEIKPGVGLTNRMIEAYKQLALEHDMKEYSLSYDFVDGASDNSFLHVYRVKLTPIGDDLARNVKPFVSILKRAQPQSPRRTCMKINCYYKREVYTHKNVFDKYHKLCHDRNQEKLDQPRFDFNVAPILYDFSFVDLKEYVIMEDLAVTGYRLNNRFKMPTYNMIDVALKTLAKFHAMSFVCQHKDLHKFKVLIKDMDELLFPPKVSTYTIECGKSYTRRTMDYLAAEEYPDDEAIATLKVIESKFKDTIMASVNSGKEIHPYAVICHGDFWNNNIMYKFDANGKAVSAKLIDYQVVRYATPVLDFVHYLFTATDRQFRAKHFVEFMDIYHSALSANLRIFDLDSDDVYSRHMFEEQMHRYGVYGFYISVYVLPFYIARDDEIIDIDEVAVAVKAIDDTTQDDLEENQRRMRALADRFEYLTERTEPIFKKRIMDIAKDLRKFDLTGLLTDSE